MEKKGIFLSTGSDDLVVARRIEESGFDFIRKPFNLKKLLDTVERMITGIQGQENKREKGRNQRCYAAGGVQQNNWNRMIFFIAVVMNCFVPIILLKNFAGRGLENE